MYKFIKEPEVKLIGMPIFNIEGMMGFLEAHDLEWPEFIDKLDTNMYFGDRDSEWMIEMAGRTCYMSWPKKGEPAKGRSHEDHIKHLIEVGHGSVLEHINFNFEIYNVSRSLTHELVRHRAGMAYSQLSQRYVNSSDVGFVMPPAIQELQKTNPEMAEKWMDHCIKSRELYEDLTVVLSELYTDIENKTEKRKRAREAARSVLPNATETKVFTTFNGRAIRHFIEMRANPAADREIRNLAVKIFRIMEETFPLVVYGMSAYKLPDGSEAIESKFRKV